MIASNAKILTGTRKIFFLILFVISGCLPDLQPSYDTIELKSNLFADKLFIKTKNWGLTGDSKITTISLEDSVDFNKEQSENYYIFKGLDPFFYRQNQDSLILYHMAKIKIPKNFNSRWKIIFNQVDNPTYMNLYKDNRYKRP